MIAITKITEVVDVATIIVAKEVMTILNNLLKCQPSEGIEGGGDDEGREGIKGIEGGGLE